MLLDDAEGLERLFELAPRFEAVGLFDGGPWADSGDLLPDLVGPGLLGQGRLATVEALSELRMLAVATGRVAGRRSTREQATDFLHAVAARNLELLLPQEEPESVADGGPHPSADGDPPAPGPAPSSSNRGRRRAHRLLALIGRHIPPHLLREQVLDEIEQLIAQAPVRTDRVERLIRLALRLPGDSDAATDARLEELATANLPLTDRARACHSLADYARAVEDLDPEALVAEARPYAERQRRTGIASPYLATLLGALARRDPAALAAALPLTARGAAEAAEHPDLLGELVSLAVTPHTTDAILGLEGVLGRGLLSRGEVVRGLRRLTTLELDPAQAERLERTFRTPVSSAALPARAILVAGALAVLGRPLGVGQGNNPTCQSARAISLWSLHAPGLLLRRIETVARVGHLATDFEGHELRSDRLGPGLANERLDGDLDPVSGLLVPHLDRLYVAMTQLAAGRADDPHRWVNPALYGPWVPRGFRSAFDVTGRVAVGHTAFVRHFLATHHPGSGARAPMLFPNPVGVLITDVRGRLLGPHAVTLQRVATDPDGVDRAYFFNPADEGRQDWGQGVRPTVAGHGEWPGESSLPIEGFASRLYAFHHDPTEPADLPGIDPAAVERIVELARTSWGRSVTFGR